MIKLKPAKLYWLNTPELASKLPEYLKELLADNYEWEKFLSQLSAEFMLAGGGGPCIVQPTLWQGSQAFVVLVRFPHKYVMKVAVTEGVVTGEPTPVILPCCDYITANLDSTAWAELEARYDERRKLVIRP